ncbi:MAG: recombinase RecA [Candidatus Liptonbacteria bacterium]|nr:recombinase RecA [Candidatus Liptonbacteria bacterium]
MPQTNVDVIPNINNFFATLFERFDAVVRKTNRADWKVAYDYLPAPRGRGVRISYDRLNKILKRFETGRNLPEYQHLEQLRELNFFYDKIEKISRSAAHVVDFTIPKGATFFANGFVNHNTTLALNVVAQAQKQGGKTAFIDAEHAMDPEYAAKLGVKINDLLISQPDNGEEALNILESLVRSGIISVIVVDSVAALTPQAELEGEMGAQHVGRQARMMAQALRKLTAITSQTQTLVIFINQLRMKIGIMFGNPETTPGGMALKFAASVRLDIRRIAQVKKGEAVVGSRVKAKVVKNKVAPPFRTAEFDIMYNEGISYEADVLNAAVKYGTVTKSGASYAFEGERLGTGFENVRTKLKEDKKLLHAMKVKTVHAVKEFEKTGGAPAGGGAEKEE